MSSLQGKSSSDGSSAKQKESKDGEVKQCLRIVAYDKKRDEYIRCGEQFTDETNTPTSCHYHEIGYFSRIGPGNWYNCCKSPDFEKPGCLVGPHSADVDDAYLRGRSSDPKSVKELRAQDAAAAAKKLTK